MMQTHRIWPPDHRCRLSELLDEVLGKQQHRTHQAPGENFTPTRIGHGSGVRWNPSERARELAKNTDGTDNIIEAMLDEALKGMA
jgi:hypothetical protein